MFCQCLTLLEVQEADYVHVWWECSLVESYLQKLGAVLKEVTGQELKLHPRVMILLDLRKYKHKDLIANMLTAAITLLAQNWKTTKVLSMQEWLLKVCYVCLLNKLSAICKYRTGYLNALKNCQSQWEVFIRSKYMAHHKIQVRKNILMLL